jgi:hypothetical protein
MQSADPIGESTDGQVGAQTSNRLSVPRSRTRLSFVKMRRSTIRLIPVSAVWKVPGDLAQTRVSLHAGKSTPLFSPAASKGTASMPATKPSKKVTTIAKRRQIWCSALSFSITHSERSRRSPSFSPIYLRCGDRSFGSVAIRRPTSIMRHDQTILRF